MGAASVYFILVLRWQLRLEQSIFAARCLHLYAGSARNASASVQLTAGRIATASFKPRRASRLLPAMASLDAARRRRRRRPLLLIGLACTTRALAPTETRRWTALRRTAGCAALAVAAPIAPAFAALNPNLGQLDPNGPNQGVVIGLDEDAPFRAALGQIKALLDTLGVEGQWQK